MRDSRPPAISNYGHDTDDEHVKDLKAARLFTVRRGMTLSQGSPHRSIP